MERGDVFLVDLNPVQGREQARAIRADRLAEGFQHTRNPTRVSGHARRELRSTCGFAVSLSGARTQTQGVVLCNQPRVLDLQARKARFIEKIPDFIIDGLGEACHAHRNINRSAGSGGVPR